MQHMMVKTEKINKNTAIYYHVSFFVYFLVNCCVDLVGRDIGFFLTEWGKYILIFSNNFLSGVTK